jgi:hypothetical protein
MERMNQSFSINLYGTHCRSGSSILRGSRHVPRRTISPVEDPHLSVVGTCSSVYVVDLGTGVPYRRHHHSDTSISERPPEAMDAFRLLVAVVTLLVHRQE